MIKEVDFKKACTEVYIILKYTEEQDVKCIPLDFMKLIKDNMDTNYNFEYNPYIELKDQKIMIETKALLGYIFLNYWADDKQKKIIENKFREDFIKEEEEKRKKYKTEDLFKQNKNEKKEVNALIKIDKETIWEKILKFLKKFLK